MPTNSSIKGLLFLLTISPVNLQYNFNSKLQLQVNRHIAEQAKVKSLSNLIRLVIQIGRIDLFATSLIEQAHFVWIGSCPILALGFGSIVCCQLMLALVLSILLTLPCWLVRSGRSSTYLLFHARRSSARLLVLVPSLSLVLQSVDLGVASSSNRQCSSRCRSSRLQASSQL